MRHNPKSYARWGPLPKAPADWTWETLMDEALCEAKQAAKNNGVPVGAVMVNSQGDIVARAGNAPQSSHDPLAHAEMLVIRKAATKLQGIRLTDCVLVVTLEPCFMCVGALVHARLAGLVYGAADAKAGAVESCLQGLDMPIHNHTVWHMGGVQAQASVELLQTFFQQRR